MEIPPETILRILLSVKAENGDLNRGLVRYYVLAYGSTSVRQIAQDVGLSRSVVERALQDWPNSGR